LSTAHKALTQRKQLLSQSVAHPRLALDAGATQANDAKTTIDAKARMADHSGPQPATTIS
jgi:hypothetical protein